MIVECLQILVPAGGKVLESHPAVRVSERYPVLEISLLTGKAPTFRIHTGDRSPSIWVAQMFRIVDNRPAPNWRVSQDEFGLKLAPASWLRRGFWEEYFDDAPAAIDDYRRELNVILQAAQNA